MGSLDDKKRKKRRLYETALMVPRLAPRTGGGVTLLKSPGLLIEGFEGSAGFVKRTASVTGSFDVVSDTDASHFVQGNGGVTLDQVIAGTGRLHKWFGNPGFDLSNTDLFSISIWSPKGRQGSSSHTLTLGCMTTDPSAAGSYANRFELALGSNGAGTSGALKPGLNTWTFKKSDFTAVGTASWANITSLMWAYTGSSAADKVTLDALYCGRETAPAFVLTMDDGLVEQYAAAMEALAAGVPVALFISPEVVGTAGRLTLSQLQALKAAGALIGGHEPTGGTEYTDEANPAAAIAGVQSYLISNGLGDGKHFSWPQGSFNADVRTAALAQGILAARGLRGKAAQVGPPEEYKGVNFYDLENTALGPAEPLYVNAVGLDDGYTFANVSSAIDLAIARGSTLILYSHRFDVAAGALTWASADFTALLALVNQKRAEGLRPMRFDAWHRALLPAETFAPSLAVVTPAPSFGANLVSKSTFADGLFAPWEQQAGTVTVESTYLKIARSGGVQGRARLAITGLELGAQYRYEADFLKESVNAAMVAAISSGSTSGNLGTAAPTSTGTWQVDFTASQANIWLFLSPGSGVDGDYAKFTNVKLRKFL